MSQKNPSTLSLLLSVCLPESFSVCSTRGVLLPPLSLAHLPRLGLTQALEHAAMTGGRDHGTRKEDQCSSSSRQAAAAACGPHTASLFGVRGCC